MEHNAHHLKVLVADEHFIVRSGMISILKRIDAQTITVLEADTYAATKKLLQNHTDINLIVLGLVLSDRSGKILVESVKEQAKDTPLIVITGHDESIVLDDEFAKTLCVIKRSSSLITIFNLVSQALKVQVIPIS